MITRSRPFGNAVERLRVYAIGDHAFRLAARLTVIQRLTVISTRLHWSNRAWVRRIDCEAGLPAGHFQIGRVHAKFRLMSRVAAPCRRPSLAMLSDAVMASIWSCGQMLLAHAPVQFS